MKEGIYKLLLTSCLLFLFESAFSQEWIPLNGSTKGQAVTMDVMEDNSSVYKVKYHIKGFYDNIITNERGSFHSLSIGDGSNLSAVGAPSLPLIHRFIAIPEGTQISVSIVDDKWTTINVGQIYPAQEQTLENEKAPEFYLDEQVYHKPFIPQQLIIGKENEWRGVRCVNLSICPFKYNPMDGRMSVMNEFILKVDFTSSALSLTKKKHYEIADPFSLFDNHIFSKTNRSGASSNCPEGDLLIIVGDNLSSSKLEEFKLWKGLKGFKTYIVSTNIAGTNTESIKNYISQQYNNGIRYVLFIGDDTKIPLMELESQHFNNNRSMYNDYWYGCVSGDNDITADIAIGRFSTVLPIDISNMIDKTIKYESSFHSLNKALLISFYDGDDDYKGVCECIHNSFAPEKLSFLCAYGDTATNNNVIQHINAGAHIVNYRGHGYTTSWGRWTEGIFRWNDAEERFHYSQINNFSDETCNIFFSIACSTGSIQEDSICMLEAFTRSSRGAVSFLGATTDTYPNVNDTLNIGLFKKIFDDGVFRIGDVVNSAHERCRSKFPVSEIDAIESPFCYVLGGDPTLELWTNVPQTINNVNFSIVGDSVYVTFDPITNDSSYCSIVRAADNMNMSNVRFSGSSVSFPKPNYNFYAAINSHNYFPYIIYCDFDTEELGHSVIEHEAHYYASPIVVRECSGPPNGHYEGVTVQNGGKLVIHKGSGGVTVEESFECKKGATFEIK